MRTDRGLFEFVPSETSIEPRRPRRRPSRVTTAAGLVACLAAVAVTSGDPSSVAIELSGDDSVAETRETPWSTVSTVGETPTSTVPVAPVADEGPAAPAPTAESTTRSSRPATTATTRTPATTRPPTVTPPAPAGKGQIKTDGEILGVYRALPEQVPAYEQWLGAEVDYVLEFWGADSDWNKIDDPSWLARRWKGTGKTPVSSIAILPNDNTTLAAGAAGQYDAHWKRFAETFVREGRGDAILRLGWEFNGRFYPWAAGGKEELFAQYWRRIVSTMRSVPGARFTFDWCPLAGNDNADVAKAYPGDDYVDYIGLDAYDASSVPASDPQARWADVRDRRWGLAWHRAFAAARQKPVTFPEWGLTVRPKDNLGGGDNPLYLQNMYDWIHGGNTAYALYFEVDAKDARHALMTPQFPKSSRMFREQWGR